MQPTAFPFTDLPIEIQDEISKKGVLSELSHVLFAYTCTRTLKKYGPTHTQKLLILIAKECDYGMFAKMEDWFMYKFVGDPKDLFKNAIKGRNTRFIHDYIDNARFNVTQRWYNTYAALPDYMMKALGRFESFDAYRALRERLLPCGYTESTIVRSIELAILRAMRTSNYAFIREATAYISIKIKYISSMVENLYVDALCTHDYHILELLDVHFLKYDEVAITAKLLQQPDEDTLVRNITKELNFDTIKRMEDRGIKVWQNEIMFNAIKFGNIPLLEYALGHTNSTLHYSFDSNDLFELICDNASFLAFRHFFEHPNVIISIDISRLMFNVSKKPYYPELIDYLLKTRSNQINTNPAV